MTYLGCDSKRRVLPVVTFVLISYLFSGELVCARPQDILSSRSADNDTKEIVADKVEPINNSTLNDRNGQPIVVEQSIKILVPENNATSTADGSKVVQNVYGDISVDSGLDFGRSAEVSTSKPVPTVNTLKPIGKIGVTPITAIDMVAADVRTPPKIKSQIVHSQLQSLLTPGKGEAIPVVLEGNDEAALEKISSDNFKYTHSDATPSSGLSTWILLNSDSVSTPYSHYKKGQKPTTADMPNTTSSENITDSKKKPVKTSTTSTTTTEKLIKSKIEAVVMKKPERKPVATIQKVNQTVAKKPLVSKIEPEEILTTTTVVSLQDSKFKNKTPVVVGKVPSTSFKDQVINTTTPMTFVELPTDNNTRKGTPVVTFPHVPVKQKSNSSTTRKPFTTSKPSTALLSSSTPVKSNSLPEIYTVPLSTTTSVEAISAFTEVTQPEIITETTTKKSSTSSEKKKKKKKKNKNKSKRRNTSKKPAKIQSKISEDDNSTSKLPVPLTTGPGNKPISTRIYNYLAREVMPNVGVGIVGLMLTAGLAGLLLYPFGGAVPVRRNYEKPGPSYNLNDYPAAGEVDNAQPEESVLSQVLAGMSNTMNQYSREQPDIPYKSHQKYKPARFDNANTYNHHKDVKYTTEAVIMEDSKFSELGDVVSGPHESVKFTSFDINDSIKYPMDNPPPSPSYSTIDLTTGQNDPVYHKYDPSNDSAKQDTSVYSTLGEYASYSNPQEPMRNPIYNGDSYGYVSKNHKNEQNTQDFKVNSDLEVGTQSPENQTTTTMKVKHEQPSYAAALEGIPKNYRTLQTSIRFEDTASVLPLNQDFVPSDGVFAASIEHGPRNMKLRRRKRDISSENEIDSILIDTTEKPSDTSQPSVQFITETTTGSAQSIEEMSTKVTEGADLHVTSSEDLKILSSTSSTENVIESFDTKNKSEPVLVVKPENSPVSVSENEVQFVSIPTIQKVEGQPANNCENCGDVSNIEEHPAPPQPFSLGKLFRKILDFKFRLGFELIRATTDVISKYLSTVQQRMTEALRDLQRSAFRMNDDKKSRTNVIKKRERRHIIHGS